MENCIICKVYISHMKYRINREIDVVKKHMETSKELLHGRYKL